MERGHVVGTFKELLGTNEDSGGMKPGKVESYWRGRTSRKHMSKTVMLAIVCIQTIS